MIMNFFLLKKSAFVAVLVFVSTYYTTSQARNNNPAPRTSVMIGNASGISGFGKGVGKGVGGGWGGYPVW